MFSTIPNNEQLVALHKAFEKALVGDEGFKLSTR